LNLLDDKIIQGDSNSNRKGLCCYFKKWVALYFSKGQQAVKDAIGRGEPVIPRGANAEKAGLPVGEKVSCSFEEKRC
jgi:hypothetical protein